MMQKSTLNKITPSAADSMIASFPSSSIEKSDEEPNHNLEKEVEKILPKNFTSIRS